MKKLLSIMFFFVAVNSTAQEFEAVDSIVEPSVVQVPLDSCDSLMVRNPDDRYGVVWKGGRCGIYDISKCENVTNIEYKELWFSFRREIEGEYYTYFGWDEEDTKGVIGVAEVNNTFVAIWFPKNDEEKKEDEK